MAELPSFDAIPDPIASDAAPRVPAAPVPAGSWTRRATRNARVAAVVVTVGWVSAVLTQLERRPDWGALSVGYWVVTFIMPVLAALAALTLASARSGGFAWVQRRAALVVLPALLAAGYMVFSERPTGSGHGDWECLAGSLVFASLPSFAAWVAFRRSFPAGQVVRSALIGFAAGAVGTTLVSYQCPEATLPHMLIGHYAATLVVMGAAALLLPNRVRA